MVHTRSQIQKQIQYIRKRRSQCKQYEIQFSYKKLKKHCILPFRRCLSKDRPLRHPRWLDIATLQQIRKLHPEIPLAPILYLDDKTAPIWKRMYWRKQFIVPVYILGHIQAMAIEYTSATSINVYLLGGGGITFDELKNAIYQYLPWVSQISIVYNIYFQKDNEYLQSMCVAIMAYCILNINCNLPMRSEIESLYFKLTAMTKKQQYDVIIDTWQRLVRPT